MRKYIIFVSLIAVTALPTTSSWAANKKMMMQMPPVVIAATTAKQTTYQSQIMVTGTLATLQGVALKPETTGRVTAIYFKSGDFVKKGAPLIQINPDILQAQLIQAKANLKLSQLTYERDQRLYKQHAISEADLDKAQAELTANNGKVKEITAYLQQNNIAAPFSGKIGLRQISLGDYIGPTQTIANLEALDPLRIDFSVAQIYLKQLKVGQTVTVTTDAYPNSKFTGKVYAFESLIDKNTRSIDVRATLKNPDHKLLPGMFVEVALHLGAPQKVVIIPQTALTYDAQGYHVYKIVDSKAVPTNVSIGHRDANTVIITQGLKPGDKIVADGVNKVYPGAKLIVR